MRTLSQLVGRGLLTYGTQVASITAPLRSPPINLEVYLTIPKRTFTAKLVNPHADPTGWPSFHNGVATGLSLRSDSKVVDSSWIIFNKPETPSAEHGGFLLGLGLTGHLRSMVSWHAYPYLEPRHDYTSIGILLGLAASYTGSQDKLLTRILSLNVQALLPDGAFDLNSPPTVQAASLLGIGLVYLGSSNHRMADVALDQIGRNVIPGIEHFADHREAYSFSAACSFGLIMLGRGSRRSGEMESHLVARLRACIVGVSPTLDGPRTAPSETDIDINVTAPGATLALGLMFLKSNRVDVSTLIALPSSPYELDHIRPDLLLIRVLAINMIHWRDIQPTQEWVRSCVPTFILTAYDNKQAMGQIDETIELAFYYIVAGCCFTLGLKYASSISESAHGVLLHYYNVFGGAAALPCEYDTMLYLHTFTDFFNRSLAASSEHSPDV
jgi:anaphase-promoting complex subunit 1